MVQEARELARQINEKSPRHQTGAKLLADFVTSLEKQDLLPKRLPAQKTESEVSKLLEPTDIRRATYDLLTNIREPSAEEREALEQKGFIFLPIDVKSLRQIYAENEKYFFFVNSSESLRSYIPPQAFEVAINTNKLRIPKSNNSSQAKQLRLIEEYSQKEIEPEFPDAKAIMLPATGYAQADIEFQKRNNGQKLLPDYWARALDTTSASDVARVGRLRPDGRLYVNGWGADAGGGSVWAVPTVVFLRK